MKKQAIAVLAVVVLLAGIGCRYTGTKDTAANMAAALHGAASTAENTPTACPPGDTAAKAGNAPDEATAAAQSAAQSLCGLPLAESGTDAALPHTLMLNGSLYVDLGEVSCTPRCGMMDGQITAVCPAGQLPQQDGQSNFGCEGMGYQWTDRGVDVYYEGEWHCFAQLCIGG